MKNKGTHFLVQGAAIAAVYVVLTLVFAPLSFGEVQIRFSEALTVLPFFTPAAIPGLFVGCIIANLLGGAIPVDIIFGSIATLIGAFFTYKLRNTGKWTAPGSEAGPDRSKGNRNLMETGAFFLTAFCDIDKIYFSI